MTYWVRISSTFCPVVFIVFQWGLVPSQHFSTLNYKESVSYYQNHALVMSIYVLCNLLSYLLVYYSLHFLHSRSSFWRHLAISCLIALSPMYCMYCNTIAMSNRHRVKNKNFEGSLSPSFVQQCGSSFEIRFDCSFKSITSSQRKVVGRPTRWSLLFIFGFLFWFSQSR